MSIRMLAVFAVALLSLQFARAQEPADEPAVTPTDLMQPGFFPDSEYGMAVEDARDGDAPRVVTTGGEFLINPAKATIECRQRIAKERTVATIQIPGGALKDLKLTHKSSGAAIFTSGKTTIRINGDSLLMISPGEAGDITASLAFTPDYFSQYMGCFNCFDPTGGISFFDHGQQDSPKVEALEDPVKITWNWKAGNVFWAGISPPKPYDWNKSITQRIVMRGSSNQRYMYPDELTLKWLARLSKFNVLYLHAENIWVSWQRDFTPQNPAEYVRMMTTANAEKLPVMVYASPKHFIEGTIVEARGRADVDDPRSAGHNSGSNAKIFMFQAKRLKERYDTAGLYFDEMYCNRKAISAAYYVARSCRTVIGDDAPFMFHCTEDVISDRAPGDLVGKTHCPTIHAYFDAIYKGEGIGMPGMSVTWENVDEKFPGYTRYNLGSYNISNVISIPCLDRGPWIQGPLLDRLMQHANARIIIQEGFLYDDRSVPYWTNYIPRLKPDLKDKLEPTLLERTGAFDRWRKAQKASAK